MNEVNPYSALFVDDQFKSYLPYLEPAADAAGIGLYAVDNVLEGLEFLQGYADIVHAVILDLSFYKGEMQGMEALQKIKTNHPRLPVVILTDSDSAEDIEKVVQCIKKGAYNYVGKKAHPVYLFQVVQAAIEHAALQAAVTYRAMVTCRQEKFYTIRKDYSSGRFTKSAVFGFELAFINKPGNEKEADTLRNEA